VWDWGLVDSSEYSNKEPPQSQSDNDEAAEEALDNGMHVLLDEMLGLELNDNGGRTLPVSTVGLVTVDSPHAEPHPGTLSVQLRLSHVKILTVHHIGHALFIRWGFHNSRVFTSTAFQVEGAMWRL
jgi:hypothetical protein